MESKTARLTILIDPVKKKAFETLCASQDLTPSQVVRQLIREYLAQHGVDYATKQSPPAGKRRQPTKPERCRHRSCASRAQRSAASASVSW
ncbi:CopG family transcriptional regulator [Cupriavidus sp. UYMU48A]|nr:CopG family transcriptional regulator [Cupriavidus sp. UYMU48A]